MIEYEYEYDNEYEYEPLTARPGVFDHEKLDVYKLELEFVAWITELLEETKGVKTSSTREVRDQIDRASISSVLNTAEGNGKRQRPLRAKYFDDARGSAAESAACLDVMVAKGICSSDRIVQGKAMAFRIAQMLTRLVQLHSEDMVRETQGDYTV